MIVDHKFVEYDKNKLNPGGIVHQVFKVYPGGIKYLVGYYRNPVDYLKELIHLDTCEKELVPVEYEVVQVSDYNLGCPIVDSIKEQHDRDEEKRKYYQEQLQKQRQQEASYMKWRAEVLMPWLEAHPGMTEKDMPLTFRLFPSLF